MNEVEMEELKGLVEGIRLEEEARERILEGLDGKRQRGIRLKRKAVIGRICGAAAAVLVLLGATLALKENFSSDALDPIMVYAAPLGAEEEGEWISVSVGEKVPIQADIDMQSYRFTLNLPSGPVLFVTSTDMITRDCVSDVYVTDTLIVDGREGETGECAVFTIKISREGDTNYIEIIQK